MSERPQSIVRSVGGLNLLSPNKFADHLRDIPLSDKVMGSMALAGCESWDEEGRYIKGPNVSLVAVGGIPLDIPSLSDERTQERLDEIAEQTRETMEFSALFSYLNSGDMEQGALFDKVVELGHLSVAHTVSLGVVVAGTSMAVENEFNSQRDLIHMSRLTVARTKVQQRPPIVVADPGNLDAVRKATEAIDAITADLTPSVPPTNRAERMDHQEFTNNLYPAAKADIFMATGSLRNWGKLTAQSDDPGKEKEYRTVLKKLQGQLGIMWPELFK